MNSFTYSEWIQNGGEKSNFNSNQTASQNWKTFQGRALLCWRNVIVKEGAKIVGLNQGGDKSFTEEKNDGLNTFSEERNDGTETFLGKKNDGR